MRTHTTTSLLTTLFSQHTQVNFDLESMVRRSCQKLENINPLIHCFLPETSRLSRLQHEAQDLEHRYNANTQKPPLYGILLGIKDIFHVDGFPTAAGSKLPPAELAGSESPLVTQLKQAGGLILGKTVTTEFAYAEASETVNPHHLSHSPGGSSSGSAAAVAAGLCSLALGSQTIGSTLRPASYCGIVGFKPSYERISRQGMVPFAPSLDTVGLFTQDSKSMELAARIILDREYSPHHFEQLPTLGVPIGPYLEQASPEVRSIFKKTVQTLRDSGYTIKEIPLFPAIDAINADIWTIAAVEMTESHKDLYPKYCHLYQPKTKTLIEKGLHTSKAAYNQAKLTQKQLQSHIHAVMQEKNIDAWICPATTTHAPDTLAHTGDPAMSIPWTLSGLPAISIPLRSSGPLPLGIQLVTRYLHDESLLSTASLLETIVG